MSLKAVHVGLKSKSVVWKNLSVCGVQIKEFLQYKGSSSQLPALRPENEAWQNRREKHEQSNGSRQIWLISVTNDLHWMSSGVRD